MPETTAWRILYIDDDPDFCQQIKELLEGELTDDISFQVETRNDFGVALEELEARRYDLVILDVRVGRHDIELPEEAGVQALQEIQQRRFVPVIFYTGLPHLVRDQESPLIRVVGKTEGSILVEEVRTLFATNLPAVNRALLRHLEFVQRDYMWGFVTNQWPTFGGTSDRSALAYLLARRLAQSLSEQGIKQLVSDLGGNPDDATQFLHPMQYYIMPPVEVSPLTGDIYYGNIMDTIGHWVLLSPSCDLVAGREKAEQVLIVRCALLSDQSEYTEWANNQNKNTVEKLQALLRNNRRKQPERYFYLPGSLTLPDLVVDFQELVMIARSKLKDLDRCASLDSPFAGALISRFARYYGRIGTPDLDIDLITNRLTPSIPEAA